MKIVASSTTSAMQQETVSLSLGNNLSPTTHHAKMVPNIGMRGLRIDWSRIRAVKATIDLIVEMRINVRVWSPRELYSGFSCFFCRLDLLLWLGATTTVEVALVEGV